MIRSLWTASTGMAAQQTNMDVIAHNLANANTTGFKRSKGNFEDLMYQIIVQPGAQRDENTRIPDGIQIGMGAKTASVPKVFTQGTFTETGNQFDLGIEGRGFFKVLRGTDEVYTRAGNFKLDSEGNVVDVEGNRLQPEISVPKGTISVSVSASGSVTAVDGSGKVVSTQQLNLYDFANPAGLVSIGHNYFIPSESSGDVEEAKPGSDGVGTLLQGFLEASNVNVVEEMVSMIISQRAYEANSKIIKTTDEMLQIANNVRA